MNKKLFLFTLIIILSINFCFADDAKISIYERTILPKSSKIGDIESGIPYSLEKYIIEMFQLSYSTNWIEKYVNEEFQYSFTKENSKQLASLLPIEGSIYVSSTYYQPNNKTVNVLLNNNIVVKLILDKQFNKIIAMEIS